MEETDDSDAFFCSTHDVRGWLVPKVQGCCLATQGELKAGPLLPAKRS